MAGWLLCSLQSALILVFVSADKVKKTEGENVTLPCKLPSSNQVIVVQWSRTDLGSEYVLRYRDEQIVSSNQPQSFKNRVDLKDTDMEDGDVSLVLKDLRTQDGGTYECKVVQRGTGSNRMKLISTISLEVAAPPPGRYEKLIRDRPDQEEDDKHSETAEKDGETQETPAPPSTTGIKAEVTKEGENDDLEKQKASHAESFRAAEQAAQKQAAQKRAPQNQAAENQAAESRAIPGVIASLSVIAVLVAVVVSVIIWRKRRPDLPPEKEQTAMI